MSRANAPAAIFDLDGTLVDSFDAHSLAWSRMGQRHGVPITAEQFERHFGRRNEQMLREIWLEAGRGELTTPTSPASTTRRKRSIASSSPGPFP